MIRISQTHKKSRCRKRRRELRSYDDSAHAGYRNQAPAGEALKGRKRKAEAQAPLAGGFRVGLNGPIIQRVCVLGIVCGRPDVGKDFLEASAQRWSVRSCVLPVMRPFHAPLAIMPFARLRSQSIPRTRSARPTVSFPEPAVSTGIVHSLLSALPNFKGALHCAYSYAANAPATGEPFIGQRDRRHLCRASLW